MTMGIVSRLRALRDRYDQTGSHYNQGKVYAYHHAANMLEEALVEVRERVDGGGRDSVLSIIEEELG